MNNFSVSSYFVIVDSHPQEIPQDLLIELILSGHEADCPFRA